MSTAPAGWHPDPTNPDPVVTPPVAQLGAAAPAWANAAPLPGTTGGPSAPFAPAAPAAPQGTYSTYATVPAGVDQRTFVKKNSFSLVTIGFLALYVVLAFAVHIVFLGILPVIMCVRAFRAKEPLAPAAAIAAAVSVGFALLTLA